MISSSNLNESLARCSWLSVLPFNHLEYIVLFPSAYRVSVEKSADILMGFPLYVVCLSHLVSFNNLSLSLIFVSLITMSLSVGLSCLGLCTS